MAIYSNFGCEIEINGYCGKHKPRNGSMMTADLVRAFRKDDGATRYYFTAYLRADGGINAIDDAVAAAPKIELTGAELRTAIEQAS